MIKYVHEIDVISAELKDIILKMGEDSINTVVKTRVLDRLQRAKSTLQSACEIIELARNN